VVITARFHERTRGGKTIERQRIFDVTPEELTARRRRAAGCLVFGSARRDNAAQRA
jgi:hypothetical protein